VTRAKVIDASVAAAIVFGEKEAKPWLDSVQGVELIAPHLIVYELASVCLKKMKLEPELTSFFLETLGRFENLGIHLKEIRSAKKLGELAAQEQLSAYDAAYLALALEHDIDLLTMDKRLAKAVNR